MYIRCVQHEVEKIKLRTVLLRDAHSCTTVTLRVDFLLCPEMSPISVDVCFLLAVLKIFQLLRYLTP